MSGTAKVAVIILAAGHSRRFGAGDKLVSRYNGKPLAAHVAASLQGVPYSFGVVVARNPSVAGLFKQTRLRSLFLAKPSTQSISLKAGLKFVRRMGASHALLLLGDMPNVPREHLKRMIAKPSNHPLICQHGPVTLPPALIPGHLIGKLLHLHGDAGAGKVLRRHPSTMRLPLGGHAALDIDKRLR